MAFHRCLHRGLLLKNICASTRLVSVKKFSSGESLVTVTSNRENGVATISMNHKPVNGMSLQMMKDAISALDTAEKEMAASAIIWTSGCKGVFGAGLQLTEVLNPEASQFREFWTTLQELCIRLYGCPIPVVAGINGHTVAGGVIFAVAADQRILANGKFKLGLNETVIGLPLPKILHTMFINVVGQNKGERLIKQGTLLSCDQALTCGLVDDLCEPDQLMNKAKEEVEKWIKIPGPAFRDSKLSFRKPVIQELLANRDQETEFFLETFRQPKTVEILQSHLNKLKK